MLAKLDPDAEVPDPLYLAALEHAASPEEVAFRDVLIFHRDFLNGGLDQALFNLSNTGQALAPYVAAYRTIGLTMVAELIEDAALRADGDAGFDEVDERYQRFTYGEKGEQPDAVEAAVLRFAQKNEAAFSSVIQAAERGTSRSSILAISGESSEPPASHPWQTHGRPRQIVEPPL